MTTMRRHVRLWVAAWLVFQVASLSALVPRDCCAAHRRATNVQANGCHQNTAATHCPMRATNGAPCPMHRGREAAGEASSHKCSIRGTCEGPLAALVALLSNHGVLTDAFELPPDLHASDVTAHTRDNPIARVAPPDPPPPRA